jgi:glycosyltransferase involved in cell wall biosynthesis
MISFIVPAFNEVDNIGATIATLRDVAADSNLSIYEIIVVDDGSTDGTGDCVDALAQKILGVSCLHHPSNLGLGTAIRSGLKVARYPQFMVVPGDNDIHHGLVKLMLSHRARADLILTVPLNKEIRTLGRNVISTLYKTIYMIAFRVFVNYINGPGIWPTEQARAVGLRSQRFSIISELNVKLLRSGCTYVEIPGYFLAAPKVRRTVTIRNLIEVLRSFVTLLYEVHLSRRQQFSARSKRVAIGFKPE